MPEAEGGAGQAPGGVSDKSAEGQAPDEFDRDRAMATIQKLRAYEKEAKAQLKEL